MHRRKEALSRRGDMCARARGGRGDGLGGHLMRACGCALRAPRRQHEPTGEQKAGFGGTFDIIDTDGSGSISLAELGELFQQVPQSQGGFFSVGSFQ